ncbi:DMT family transporter [Microvirga antarctica]|uniref:DMT family transporter n=1 Tax=Microvirga antarctica TaxID=2819233 RepID=UPI001B301937|nr:DMT family transporter [Microvirga antarctica]
MRRSLDTLAICTVLVLCASWGLQQVTVKLALPTFPPMTQMTIRSVGAGAMVLVWCMFTGRGKLLARDGSLFWGLFAGSLFAIEFMMIYTGLQWTEASRGTVFMYTAPFFVALGAMWLLPEERLTPIQWVGLLLSFLGVVLALGMPSLARSPLAFSGDLLILMGGALWGATTLAIKASPLRAISPEKVLLYQLGMGAVAGVIGMLVLGERLGAPTTAAVWAMIYQTVWVAGITFLLWFKLLAIYPASRLQAGTSLSPLFGVLGAFVILGEPLSISLVLAALLVVSGVILVNRR